MLDQLDLTQNDMPAPSLSLDTDTYEPLYVHGHCRGIVSVILKDGYFAACHTYQQMEEQDEYGPCIFLSGYEYAHLARKHMPADVSPRDRYEWQRGFVFGWNVCMLGLADYMVEANKAPATR